MKLITQTILDDVNGDCLTCCVAMVTRIPRHKIPNFCAGNNANWWAECQAWLLRKNWVAVLVRQEASMRQLVDLSALQDSPLPFIAFDRAHAVVQKGGRQYDPHPLRAGIAAWDSLILMIPLL